MYDPLFKFRCTLDTMIMFLNSMVSIVKSNLKLEKRNV